MFRKLIFFIMVLSCFFITSSVYLAAESEVIGARHYPDYTWRGESEEVRINYFEEHEDSLEANMTFHCEEEVGYCRISVYPPGPKGPRVIADNGEETYVFKFLYAEGIPYGPEWMIIRGGESVTFKWFFEYFDCDFLPVNIYETPSENQDWYWEDVEWDCFEPPVS